MIKVSSTYGDGPDILLTSRTIQVLSLDNVYYSEIVNNWQLDLTIEQARQLVFDLTNSINFVQSIIDIATAHDESLDNE